jgi:predicted NUDIX family NTP pyrophosphohydrolase
MKPVNSAGCLMYRINQGVLEILLGHPGGPYYLGRDEGVWSIPKGQAEANESLLETAIREFREETGWQSPLQGLSALGHVATAKKHIHIWAFAGNCDASNLCSNMFQMEWPPQSGIMQDFPEFDRLAFFSLSAARRKIERSQIAFIDKLIILLGQRGHDALSA